MEESAIRVLVVDDYEPWQRFVATKLGSHRGLEIIGQVSDGFKAVQRARELQPDLILLDIGLPTLDGIEVARRIRVGSPKSKIIFVSENRSVDVVKKALSTGAGGYVVKSNAARELLRAVKAVLEGKRFVSAAFTGYDLTHCPKDNTHNDPRHNKVGALLRPPDSAICRHHKVGFYSDDRYLLDDVTQFIGTSLEAGKAAIVVATESHRESLLPRLQAHGLDIGAAIAQGRYIGLDAVETLSTFMVNGMPDPVRFVNAFGRLILTAAKTAKEEHPRVAIFGECVNLLWAEGNAEAAIQMEKLGNQLANSHDVGILCGYSLGSLQGVMDSDIFQRICAEHSVVHGRELGY